MKELPAILVSAAASLVVYILRDVLKEHALRLGRRVLASMKRLSCYIMIFISWIKKIFPQPSVEGRFRPMEPGRDFPDGCYRRLFVYGSLLDVGSLRKTLMRSAPEIRCIPAIIRGYRRSWGAPARRYDLIDPRWQAPQDELWWLSLILEETGNLDDAVQGVIISIETARELRELGAREERYRLRELRSHRVFRRDTGEQYPERVFSYFPKADLPEIPRGEPVAIREGYRKRVLAGLKALGIRDERIEPVNDPRYLDAQELAFEPIEALVQRALREHQDRLAREWGNLAQDLRRKDAVWIRQGEVASRIISTSLAPVLLASEDYWKAGEVAEAALRLATKALRVAVAKPDLGQWCGLAPDSLELVDICLQRGDVLPEVARVDMTLHQGRLRLFEINCDSPGGMYHFDVLRPWQSDFCGRLRLPIDDAGVRNLCDEVEHTVADRLRDVERHPERADGPVRLAIVEEHPERWQTLPEMLGFLRRFRKLRTPDGRPVEAFLCEAEHLTFDGDRLHGRRKHVAHFGRTTSVERELTPIDLVYKRILHSHARRTPRVALGLEAAYRNGTVSVVNTLLGFFAGFKSLMALLGQRRFPEWAKEIGEPLTEPEVRVLERHVPMTTVWGAQLDGDGKDCKRTVMEKLDRYFVVKPFDDFGGGGFTIKGDEGGPGWVHKFEKAWNQGFTVQEYVPHGRLTVPVKDDDETIRWRHQFVMLGAYVINGRFAGLEAKLGDRLPIGMGFEGDRPKGYRTVVFPVANEGR